MYHTMHRAVTRASVRNRFESLPPHSAVILAKERHPVPRYGAGIHQGGKRSSRHDRTVTHSPRYFTITRKSDRMRQNTTHLEEHLQHTVALNPLWSHPNQSSRPLSSQARHTRLSGAATSLRLSLRGNGRNCEHYPTIKKPLDRLATVRGATLEEDVKE